MLGAIAGQREDFHSKRGKSEAGWGGQRPGHGLSTLAVGLSQCGGQLLMVLGKRGHRIIAGRGTPSRAREWTLA